jgi:hypothetical protein
LCPTLFAVEIPGWAIGLGSLVAAVLAALGGLWIRIRRTARADRAAEAQVGIDRREREQEIDHDHQTFVIKHLQKVILDQGKTIREQEAQCESKIKALHEESRELRESERLLFAENARLKQLVEVMQERDTKMRHGLADAGIGVRSVEGPLLSQEKKHGTDEK